MEYTVEDIRGFQSAWRGYYEENDCVGHECVKFSCGRQWDPVSVQERTRRGEFSITLNISGKHLLRVKGEADQLKFSLHISGNNIDPKLMKEGRQILQKIILSNNNMDAFSRALCQVYEFGYSAILVTTKQEKPGHPSKLPHLMVFDDLENVFFDTQCKDDFKTEGRFCGVRCMMSEDVALGKRDYAKKNDTLVEVIDFWYREPYRETWYFSQKGEWTKTKQSGDVSKQEMLEYRVKYMRTAGDKVVFKPINYYTKTKLPLVYWKGNEKISKECGYITVKTIPYVLNLMDSQDLINYAASALIGRLSKLGGSKAIVSSEMIKNKEEAWKNFNRSSGVMMINEGDAGMVSPVFVPPEMIDANLLNALNTAVQQMDIVAGVAPAQEGARNTGATNAGLQRQIMQGDALHKIESSLHIKSINEVGRILTEMTPEVIVEDRDIGNGLRVNVKESDHTPSAPKIRNDISMLFNKVNFHLEAAPSSDVERAVNLQGALQAIQVNPALAPYLLPIIGESTECTNRDQLMLLIEATMPPYITELRNGEISVKQYRELMEAKQKEEQSTPSPDQEKMELEKQKLQMAQQAKQQEIQLKFQKTENQKEKDIANVQLKSAALEQKDRAIDSQNKLANKNTTGPKM